MRFWTRVVVVVGAVLDVWDGERDDGGDSVPGGGAGDRIGVLGVTWVLPEGLGRR